MKTLKLFTNIVKKMEECLIVYSNIKNLNKYCKCNMILAMQNQYKLLIVEIAGDFFCYTVFHFSYN